MVSEAYLQGLLEQIVGQVEGGDADQTEYYESGSFFNDQREHEPIARIISRENHPVMVQNDFLGHKDQVERNDEAPYGVTSNTIPRVRPVAARITHSNPVNVQPDLRDRVNNQQRSQPRQEF